MFGVYRTFLAFVVMAHHLLGIPFIGHYAVHGFFILSGYLMTLIMCEKYGYSIRGVRLFAINRWLRLYPSYFVILVLTVCIVAFYGGGLTTAYRNSIFLPHSFTGWTQNISLIFLNIFPTNEVPRLSPPTWSLTVELMYYAFIALGLSRSKRSCLLWLIVSVVYMLATHVFELGYQYRYNIIFAGSLPFALGANIYHYRGRLCALLSSVCKPLPIIGLVVLFLLNGLWAAVTYYRNGFDLAFYISYYSNYIINCLLIISLINFHPSILKTKSDQKIGEFSYPMYLLHWQTGFISSMLLWGKPIHGLNYQGVMSFIFALVICLILSWVIVTLVEHPIQKLRFKIGNSANRPEVVRRQPAGLSRGLLMKL